jgi:hypothetical protein
MTRNQIGITVGGSGFFICAGVFVFSLLQQLAYVEVVSCLAAWGQLFIASAPILEALDNEQVKSVVPSIIGAALTASVLVFYAIAYYFSSHFAGA